MNSQPPNPLLIPIRTLVRVVAIFIIWLILELRHILLLVFIAFLLAAALAPLVHRLTEHGWPLGAAVGAPISVIVVLILVGVWFLIPELVAQGQVLVDTMPNYIDRAQVILRCYPALNERIRGFFDPAAAGEEATTVPVSRLIEAGTTVVQGLVDAFVILVMAVYILLDGDRITNTLARYLSSVQLIKFRKAMPEFVSVVSGYVVGQFITSLLFGVFAFVTLTAFGVPQPLLLALLAAFMDAIPIVGVPVATIPAVLAGLTVSTPTAIGVLVLYIVYQQIENYLLVSRIYGRTLHVAPLSVLIGVLAGGELLDIIGVLLALPLTAAIPIIVRLWREDVEAPPAETREAPPSHDDGTETDAMVHRI
jgi:predicted PurR-regulated permease PerM